jgi:hypothetical protein
LGTSLFQGRKNVLIFLRNNDYNDIGEGRKWKRDYCQGIGGKVMI